MSSRNMTPEQRAFPKPVQREAYQRLPETCDNVSAILDEAAVSILLLGEPDEASVDAVMRQAFFRIRDEVTQPFRTEQMKLINHIQGHPDDRD